MKYDELLVVLKDTPLVEAREMMRKGEQHFQRLINDEHNKKQKIIYNDIVKSIIKDNNLIVGTICISVGRTFKVTSIGKPTHFGASPRGYKIVETRNGKEIEYLTGLITRFFEVVMAIAHFTNYQAP